MPPLARSDSISRRVSLRIVEPKLMELKVSSSPSGESGSMKRLSMRWKKGTMG